MGLESGLTLGEVFLLRYSRHGYKAPNQSDPKKNFCLPQASCFHQRSNISSLSKYNIFSSALVGVVVRTSHQAATELEVSKGLRSGLLLFAGLCQSDVRTKLGINMVNFGEPSSTRLHKEERTGSGWKHSRQKFPRQTVVG